MLNLEVIGQRIAQYRKNHDMNQNDLAEALFVTRQAVSKWEMGKSLPSIDMLLALTKLFNISIDSLLDDSDIKTYEYKDMMNAYPRDSVIYKFLQTDHPNNHIKDIFYLLTPAERKQLIDQSLSKHISLSTTAIWPYASVAERKYILGNLLSKQTAEDVREIYPLMTGEERLMVSKCDDMNFVIYNNQKGGKA